MKKTLVVTLWALALYLSWYYVGNFFAPEACLDFGGSFNYETWRCSHSDNQTYLETPFFKVPGFIPALISVATAIIVSIALRLNSLKQRV